MSNTYTDTDWATGKPVNFKLPEEPVRQEYERVLVSDYGYPKDVLDIKVGIPMGSATKECDIAVYDSPRKDNIIGIVETKKPKDKTGLGQLKSYMSATSTCIWGVLTNGSTTTYLSKGQGGIIEETPSIPHYGQTGAAVLTFATLKKPNNLKWTFRHIMYQLYANSDISRKEKQGAEMVRLLFCKMADEDKAQLNPKYVPEFQIKANETASDLQARIKSLWEYARDVYVGGQIFGRDEVLTIDDTSLLLVVRYLQAYSVLNTDQDVVGNAFEIFAERQFAGDRGQFFTPRDVVKMAVSMVNPKRGDKILDPACGSGGFLISAYNHITQGIPQSNLRTRISIAQSSLFGIDRDPDLVKICKAQMAIIGDGKTNIVRANTLRQHGEWDVSAQARMTTNGNLNQFDVILTNPPFGSKIKVDEKEILKHYDLGHKWQNLGDDWQQSNKTQTRPPQVLFIERCLEMLKPGGKLGIVLPDGLLGNTGDAYIRKFILDKAVVLAVVDCPTETFAPHTPTKTSVLILQKLPAQTPSNIFFAIASECGHNKRGTPTGKSDFAKITATYNQHLTSDRVPQNWFGFYADRKLDKRRILVPRYYDPLIIKEIASFDDKQWDMVSMQNLIAKSAIEISGISGCPTSLEYDARGEIRFIRTSDVSGFEVGEHAQIKIPLDVWETNKASQDLKIGDILFVKDGDDKIGNCAILIDETDLKISVQSHFHKIRSLTIDPYLLLWALNTPIVEKQIRQRVFSQSTLKTIGIRITELVLPLPKDDKEKERIATETKQCIVSRRKAWLKMRATMPK